MVALLDRATMMVPPCAISTERPLSASVSWTSAGEARPAGVGVADEPSQPQLATASDVRVATSSQRTALNGIDVLTKECWRPEVAISAADRSTRSGHSDAVVARPRVHADERRMGTISGAHL